MSFAEGLPGTSRQMHGIHLLHHELVSRHAGNGGHFRSGVRRSRTAGKAETGGAKWRENGRIHGRVTDISGF